MESNYNSFGEYTVKRDLFGNTIVENDIGVRISETSHRIPEGNYKGYELIDHEFGLNRYSEKNSQSKNDVYDKNSSISYDDYDYSSESEEYGVTLAISL